MNDHVITRMETMPKPDTECVQALTDVSRSALCYHGNESVHRLQIRPIMHKQTAPPTIPPSYIRVRAVMWECGEEQTDRHSDGRDQYTFCLALGYASREM